MTSLHCRVSDPSVIFKTILRDDCSSFLEKKNCSFIDQDSRRNLPRSFFFLGRGESGPEAKNANRHKTVWNSFEPIRDLWDDFNQVELCSFAESQIECMKKVIKNCLLSKASSFHSRLALSDTFQSFSLCSSSFDRRQNDGLFTS